MESLSARRSCPQRALELHRAPLLCPERVMGWSAGTSGGRMQASGSNDAHSMRSAQFLLGQPSTCPCVVGETEAQGGNAPAAVELGHSRARPGPRPALLSLPGGARGGK